MGIEWYDMIARRNGGYKSNAIFTIEGQSGEDVFEERLISMLPNFKSVLDSGCGHGEFTIKMAKHAAEITGLDGSIELLKIAEDIKKANNVSNVKFVLATTKKELPFKDDEFDLIYNRRGPTSILNHNRILKEGGTVFGIHPVSPMNPTNFEVILNLLNDNGFVDIEYQEYNQAYMYFPNDIEFTKEISSIPGNPDYFLPENRADRDRIIEENTINGRLKLKQWRYVWKARKP